MSNKSYKSSLYKRIIDIGKVTEAEVTDLVRIWRVGSGDEKAITLENFVLTVNEELGEGGKGIKEQIEDILDEIASLDDTFVRHDTQTQNLPEQNKENARHNIDVYSIDEVDATTGFLQDLNTSGKSNLVEGINIANSWNTIEF